MKLSAAQMRAAALCAVRANPPALPDAIVPAPIVIGDGPLARDVVAAMCAGWGYPGDPLHVDCIGPTPQWAQLAAATVSNGQLTFTRAPWLDPEIVAQQAAQLMPLWDAPPARSGRVAGPTIIVAVADVAQARQLAGQVAQAVPQARVSFVDQTHTGAPETLRGVVLAEIDAVAAAPATAPLADIFAADPATKEAQAEAIAEAATQLLDAGQLAVGPPPATTQPLVPTPGELADMAQALLELLGLARSPQRWVTALEFVFRLPRLAARAGWTPHRPAGYRALLSFDQLELLAPLVHHAYQEAAAHSGNATGSPLSSVAWDALSAFDQSANRQQLVGSAVAFAAVGCDWRLATQPRLPDWGDLLERLGELEHRRWAQVQRANGRAEHVLMVPWEQLTPEQQAYDMRLMQAMPYILSQAGIEVYHRGSC